MEIEAYYAAITAFKSTHENAMIHYGIPGQKWGHRRYQNPDGTYTVEGYARWKRALDHYDTKIAKGGSEKKINRLKQKRAATYLNMRLNERANKDAKNTRAATATKAIRRLALAGAIGAAGYAAYRKRNQITDFYRSAGALNRLQDRKSADSKNLRTKTIVSGLKGLGIGGGVGAVGAHAINNVIRRSAKGRNDKYLRDLIARDKDVSKAYNTIRGTKYEKKVRKRSGIR